MNNDHEITLSVTYGLGATVSTVVARHAIAGFTVREAIETALKSPQAPGSQQERVAAMVGEALRSGRTIDIELSGGASNGVGRPVTLDDGLVLSDVGRADHTEGTATVEEEIHLSLSESYRGGWLQ